jgi:hypothetical protein
MILTLSRTFAARSSTPNVEQVGSFANLSTHSGFGRRELTMWRYRRSRSRFPVVSMIAAEVVSLVRRKAVKKEKQSCSVSLVV